MQRISLIGSLLKKLYRAYSADLIHSLSDKGFYDLRPSFLEILMYIASHEGTTIKEIGLACGLKKQTMTSHLNELEKRDYILRKESERDRREQNIVLTDYGRRFKLCLFQSIDEIEAKYGDALGEIELERMQYVLTNFHEKIQEQAH